MGFVRGLGRGLLGLAVILGAACSPGDPLPTQTLVGQTAASNALVWLDSNGNLSPDPGEASGRTTPSGGYALSLPDNLAADEVNVVVRIEAGLSRSSDGRPTSSSYFLLARAKGGDVSVWTTLVAAIMARGEAATTADAQAKIRTAFVLPLDFDFSWAAAANDPKIARLSQVVQAAYAQRAVALSSRPTASPSQVMMGAAGEIMGMAAQLIDLARQPTPSTGQVLGSSRPLESGVFHGDFAAIPVNANMTYGIGLDEASYGLKGEVCTETPVHTEGLCANDDDYSFELVGSVDELSKKFSIGASAKTGVSVAGFDVVSVSGGFNFIKNSEFKKDSLYILFRTEQKQCGYPATVVLKPEWQALFTSNFEQFRATCGDRYLSSLTSGGWFAALIEVKKDENSKDDEFRLNLSGKVLGATVFNKTWKDTLIDINKQYTTHTRVVSNLFTYTDDYLTVDGVFAQYDLFAAAMKDVRCSTATGWKDCAYLATFSRYETISATPPGKASSVQTELRNMQALEAYYFETVNLLDDLAEMLIHPDDYNIGQRVDTFSAPNDWTTERLMAWQTDIEGYQAAATAQWGKCHAAVQDCTKNPVSLGLPTWLELKKKLPTPKFIFPESCSIKAKQSGVTTDGENWLYLGGDTTKSYRVYCHDMASSAPKTYLKLQNTSANVSGPSYNYSSLHYAANDGGKGVITRIFQALLVEPRSDAGTPYLEVIRGQGSYTEWAAEPVLAGDSQLLLAQSLGVLEAQGQGSAQASANLNLEGTSFTLSSMLDIQGDGAFSQLLWPISADRQNVDLRVVAGVARTTAPIRLDWAAAK